MLEFPAHSLKSPQEKWCMVNTGGPLDLYEFGNTDVINGFEGRNKQREVESKASGANSGQVIYSDH